VEKKTQEYDRQILACNCFDQIMTFLSFTIIKSAIDAKGPTLFLGYVYKHTVIAFMC
jgi:hypothetical protein